jgi:glutamate synthase (NADPH/NADH) small chain
LEKYITDTAWEEGWVKVNKPTNSIDRSVGIIGAGPGGLAAADILRQEGLEVTIYDRYDRAGGLLTYGIPGFKLEKDIVMRRSEQLEKSGVKFVLNTNVGVDITFDKIRERHDFVILATGVYKARELDIPNSSLNGKLAALDYLTASNKLSFGDRVKEFESGGYNADGKKVVVIGGGDTAMDCVRTAVRQGATSVKCLYRRDRANMPGSQREVQNAEEEGVIFEWLTSPKSLSNNLKINDLSNFEVQEGDLKGIIVKKMRLGDPDATGRRTPEEITGSEYFEEADLVIEALGFEPEDLPTLWDQPELPVSRWGTIKVEYGTGKTNLENVYAVGDIVRGASLVVWAIKDGREAANAILNEISVTKVIAAE